MEKDASKTVQGRYRRHEGPFQLGERVSYRDACGTVVANLGTRQFAPTLARHSCEVLRDGILVEWDDHTLTHIREPAIVLRRPAQSL